MIDDIASNGHFIAKTEMFSECYWDTVSNLAQAIVVFTHKKKSNKSMENKNKNRWMNE